MMDFVAAGRAELTLQEAKDIFGISGAIPGAAELKALYRQRSRELHPDLNPGAPADAQAKLNIAFDVLTGAATPRYDYRQPSAPGAGYSSPWSQNEAPQARQQPPAPPPRTEKTLAEAVAESGLPYHQVEWLFVTPWQRSPHNYSSDEYSRSERAFVAYGKFESYVIFATVRNSEYSSYVPGDSRPGHDIHEVMWSKVPANPERINDRTWLTRHVQDALHAASRELKFNRKVIDLQESWDFRKGPPHSGKPVLIDQWLTLRGFVEDTDPEVTGKKQQIGFSAAQSWDGDKPGFVKDPSPYGSYWYKLTLSLNGRPVVLNPADTEAVLKARVGRERMLDAIFGRYVSEREKQLMRLKHGKVILEWMSQKLTGLSERDRQVLSVAAAQIGGGASTSARTATHWKAY